MDFWACVPHPQAADSQPGSLRGAVLDTSLDVGLSQPALTPRFTPSSAPQASVFSPLPRLVLPSPPWLQGGLPVPLAGLDAPLVPHVPSQAPSNALWSKWARPGL